MRERGISGEFVCPCCGYATLGAEGGFGICRICLWEDDGQDDPVAHEFWAGPNPTSLEDARRNYILRGASDMHRNQKAKQPTEQDERLRFYELVNGDLSRVK
jgi:hypothetical protein